jgi:hypothetical protein
MDGSLAHEVVKQLLAMNFTQDSIDLAVETLHHARGRENLVEDSLVDQLVDILVSGHPQPELLRHRSGPRTFFPQHVGSSVQGYAGTMSPPTLERNLSKGSGSSAEGLSPTRPSLQSVARLLLRAVDYEEQGMITSEDRGKLQKLVAEGRHQEVRALLDEAEARASGRCKSTCLICFDEIQDGYAFKLECGHVFCSDCMAGHCAAVAYPGCPDTTCGHKFTEDEVLRACGTDRLQAFQEMRLQQAVEQLEGRVACPNPECFNVVLCEAGVRQKVVCQCAWPPFCSLCRQLYHPRKSCSDVGMLRQQWANWVSFGRREYHGRVEAAAVELEQQRPVQEALQRQRDLEADEEYKAANCRCCPMCGRTVQKLDGCDQMKCGQNFHGGNRQDGCGADFDWKSAPRYIPRVERRPAPTLDIQRLRVEGRDFRHFLVSCDHCGAINITGPRFQCVHCPSFNICSDCDLRGTANHPGDHVFEIFFTPEQSYNLDLPVGTKVELVGLVENITLNSKEACVERFIPGLDVYDLKLRKPFDVPIEAERESMVSTISGMIPDEVSRRVPYGLRKGLGTFLGGIEHTLGQAVTSLTRKADAEIILKPGERVEDLRGMPARFLQLATGSVAEVAFAVEAVEVQRSARRTHWTALPIGTKVQVFAQVLLYQGDEVKNCPHSQDRATCTRCKIRDTLEAMKGNRELRGDVATVTGPYIGATSSYQVTLDSDSSVFVVPSRRTKPIVTKPLQLGRLEQFHAAQQEARKLRLNLPVGQLVELDGRSEAGEGFSGQLATIEEPFDHDARTYIVRLRRGDGKSKSQIKQSQEMMAEQLGIVDLLTMNIVQLRELWSNHGLSCRGLHTPDAFIDQALEFLPEVKPAKLSFRVGCVHPIIADAEDVLSLQERQARVLSEGTVEFS